MNFIKQIERIKRVNRLIKYKATGNPDEFAERIGISRRQLYNIIELLKDFGANIKYDREKETFYYSENEFIDIVFSVKILNGEEEKDIFAGFFQKKSAPCNFIARKDTIFILENYM